MSCWWSPGLVAAGLVALLAGTFSVTTRLVANTRQLLLLSQLVIGSALLAPFGMSVPLPDLNETLFDLGKRSCSASGTFWFFNRRAKANWSPVDLHATCVNNPQV